MKEYREVMTIVLVAFGFLMIGLKLGEAEYEELHTPVDNQLIQMNDSTYYRISVRVDTTYFRPNIK